MSEKKTILIGCDDAIVLSRVLNILSSISDFTISLVSVSRVIDLNKTSNSLKPDIILLCFKKNQPIINDYNFNFNKKDIPILCLTRNYECESSCWSKNCIVFSFPYNQINNPDFFIYRIQSIFLLKKTETKNNPIESFAESSYKKNNYNNYNDHSNNRELSHYVMELDQKVEILQKVKERISYLFPNVDDSTRSELISIVNSIKTVANDNKLWEDFKIYFELSNPKFLLALAKKHPSLSSKDLKYCCYIKMNMSNNDITNLLGINQESVRTHKYRLKKKLTLKKDQDIVAYLRTVS